MTSLRSLYGLNGQTVARLPQTVQSAQPLCLMLWNLCHKHSTRFISSRFTWLEPYLLKADHGLVTRYQGDTCPFSHIIFLHSWFLFSSPLPASQSIHLETQTAEETLGKRSRGNKLNSKNTSKTPHLFFQYYIRVTFHLDMHSEQCTRP